ncbi:MAG: endolytic transglycosylase MltG [Prevotella sp.]|nr:endolytic transglycosylase MltG [Prevotella sp.]
MTTKSKRLYQAAAALCLLIFFGILYYYFFCSFSNKETTQYVYIDEDDNVDSVIYKVKPLATSHGMSGLLTLVRHSSYPEQIRSGRYAIESGDGAFAVFRRIKNGLQEPVNLTIPCVRTMDKLAEYVGSKLMIDSDSLYAALSDEATCQKYGYDTLTIACMFIPNTYDIYWNISLDKFLERMKKESDSFWNEDRMQKASSMGFDEVKTITLASIVDEETTNSEEKPMVAGMYYNRLKSNMPLQADPTIKFALKDFSLKRIYHNMLSVNSPFNTYQNTGLPPGPIRIPTIDGIDAVLDHAEHDYLYMCAKEDFSGSHNFAKTYEEHLKNAEKYSRALNARGIK